MLETSDTTKFNKLIELAEAFATPKLSLSGELKPNFDDLILSDFWPNEVEKTAIVTTPDEMAHRAKSIIDVYGNIKGKKFLDVGCGLGHCVTEASNRGAVAWGFDIEEAWDKSDTCTIDFNVVQQQGPYDFVSVYDVVDHVVDHKTCVTMMKLIHSVCTPSTTIRVRCHPWTSRHGGHLYLTINKAFAHILLSTDALNQLKSERTRQIHRPLHEYRKLFSESGFTIESQNKITHPLEDLFQTPPLVAAFQGKLKSGKKWQADVLPITFIDYILKIR